MWKIRDAQDSFCEKATRDDRAGLGDYSEDLQQEALVDISQGCIKVQSKAIFLLLGGI